MNTRNFGGFINISFRAFSKSLNKYVFQTTANTHYLGTTENTTVQNNLPKIGRSHHPLHINLFLLTKNTILGCFWAPSTCQTHQKIFKTKIPLFDWYTNLEDLRTVIFLPPSKRATPYTTPFDMPAKSKKKATTKTAKYTADETYVECEWCINVRNSVYVLMYDDDDGADVYHKLGQLHSANYRSSTYKDNDGNSFPAIEVGVYKYANTTANYVGPPIDSDEARKMDATGGGPAQHLCYVLQQVNFTDLGGDFTRGINETLMAANKADRKQNASFLKNYIANNDSAFSKPSQANVSGGIHRKERRAEGDRNTPAQFGGSVSSGTTNTPVRNKQNKKGENKKRKSDGRTTQGHAKSRGVFLLLFI